MREKTDALRELSYLMCENQSFNVLFCFNSLKLPVNQRRPGGREQRQGRVHINNIILGCCGDAQDHSKRVRTVNVLDYVNVSHGPSLHGTARFVCLLSCPHCGALVTKVTAVFTMGMCRMPAAMPEFGSI